MLTADSSGGTFQDDPQEGWEDEVLPEPVKAQDPRCNETTVLQCVAAVEQSVLESHRDGNATDDQVRTTMWATSNAKRALADGKSDPCRIVLDMLRDMTPRE